MCSFIGHGQTKKVLAYVVNKDQMIMLFAHFFLEVLCMRELCAYLETLDVVNEPVCFTYGASV